MRVMATPTQEREYLSVAEVALKLAVSAATVRRWIATGHLRAVQPAGPGTAVRVPAGGLEAWLTTRAAAEEGDTDAA